MKGLKTKRPKPLQTKPKDNHRALQVAGTKGETHKNTLKFYLIVKGSLF